MALPTVTTNVGRGQSALFTDEVQKAWHRQCDALRDRDRDEFRKHACTSIQDYLQRLEDACRSYEEGSRRAKIVEWFEPLHKAVELITPAAAVAIQAYPNPGSLVLGGIVGLLSLTDRLLEYQKLTLQMLSRMGRKAKFLVQYEDQQGMFKDDTNIRNTLLSVYGDILSFCDKAFRFLVKKNGKLHARVKGFRLIAFRDYESHFEDEIRNFNDHVEDLEAYAAQCFRRYVEAMSERDRAHHVRADLVFKQAQDHFGLQTKALEVNQVRARRKDIFSWLEWLSSSDDLTLGYDKCCDEHLTGTGSWLLRSDVFRRWKSQDRSNLLWVTGKPGCGKSILAAVAAMDLSLDTDAAIAYAFYRGGDISRRDSTAIMGALAQQLGRQASDVTSIIDKYPVSSGKPTHFALQKIIKALLGQLGKVHFVIDGLDEFMTDRKGGDDDFSRDLVALLSLQRSAALKIIVFSRPEHQLEQRFDRYARVRVDLGANEADLVAYIEDRFPDERYDRGMNRQLREVCLEKAQGMFLWVKLLWQYLDRENLHSGQKLARVSKMPGGLEQLYEDIMHKIWNQDEDVRSTALLVLAWVIHGLNVLHGVEMLDAVAEFVPGKAYRDTWRYPKPERLVTLCMGLVYLDSEECFRLCHESARNFLEGSKSDPSEPLRNYYLLRETIHNRLTVICLQYIAAVDYPLPQDDWMIDLLLSKRPFLAYAAKKWYKHAAAGDPDVIHGQIANFLTSHRNRYLSAALGLRKYDESTGNQIACFSNPLHILASVGLWQVARHLPDIVELSQEHIDGRCLPLSSAIYNKQLPMCEWLIDNTPSLPSLRQSPDRFRVCYETLRLGWNEITLKLISEGDPFVDQWSSECDRSLLLAACEFGRSDIVKVLLEYGADIHRCTEDQWNSLHLAVWAGSEATVCALLRAGADILGRTDSDVTALHLAASQDNDNLLNLLISWPGGALALDLRDRNGLTPLHSAASSGKARNIMAIHKAQPNLNILANGNSTPLHLAAQSGSEEAVTALLDLGAARDTVDDVQLTALSIAAARGFFHVVDKLLRGGCSISVPNAKSVLIGAVISGSLAVVNMILKGCKPGERDSLLNGDQHIAHHSAVISGHHDIFHALIDAGAKLDRPDRDGCVALHWTARYGRVDMSKTVLTMTRQANPVSSFMNTPLHLAAFFGHTTVIEQLMEHCTDLGLSVDIGALNLEGNTPLMCAIGGGHEEASILLSRFRESNKPNSFKTYPILSAAAQNLDLVVQQLLDQEGTLVRMHRGVTPIIEAANRGHLSTVKILAIKSMDILDAANDDGWTALASAVRRHHSDVAHYLLDLGADPLLVPHPLEAPETLLHFAAAFDDTYLIKRLLDKGCEKDARNWCGSTALHVALVRSPQAAKVLIRAGAGVNIVRPDGSLTCAMLASMWGDVDVLSELVDHGCSLGGVSDTGDTVAHLAARYGRDSILRYLVKSGTRMSTLNSRGDTPLVEAVVSEYPSTVKYLLKIDSTVLDHRNQSGYTALHLAAAYNRPAILRDLLEAGSDPYRTDIVGMIANDHALDYTACMREMHRAGYFCRPTGMDSRLRMSWDIVLSCQNILQFWNRTDGGHTMENIITLSNILRFMGDFDIAKSCMVELCARYHEATGTTCNLCRRDKVFSNDTVFLCKMCPRMVILCKACHRDYVECGDKIPQSIAKLANEILKPLYDALPALDKCRDVLEFFRAMMYVDGAAYMKRLILRLKEWKTEYNQDERFSVLLNERTILDFINIMDDAMKLAPDIKGTTKSTEAWSHLQRRWTEYKRRHRGHGFRPFFPCKNHHYLEVKKAEASNADRKVMMLSRELLFHLIVKYSDALLPGEELLPGNVKARDVLDHRRGFSSRSHPKRMRRRASVATICTADGRVDSTRLLEQHRGWKPYVEASSTAQRSRSLSPGRPFSHGGDPVSGRAVSANLDRIHNPHEIAAEIKKQIQSSEYSRKAETARQERDRFPQQVFEHLPRTDEEKRLFRLAKDVLDAHDPAVLDTLAKHRQYILQSPDRKEEEDCHQSPRSQDLDQLSGSSSDSDSE